MKTNVAGRHMDLGRTRSALFIVLMISMAGFQFTSAQEAAGDHARQRRTVQLTRQTSSEIPEGITRAQAEAILVELRAIHQLLQKPVHEDPILLVPTDQPNPNSNGDKASLNFTGHWHSLGQENSLLILVEFTDFQCPFCRVFEAEIFPKMKAQYIDTGKLRYVSLDLPLAQHAGAKNAAEAVRCLRCIE
jgi:protein-disulfide isomerase